MEKNLETLRHSTSHVMAQAVIELFGPARLAIGPSIEDGFYYDFELEHTFVPEDLEKIEAKMKEITKAGYEFVSREISKDEARKLFKDNKYKLELIEDIEGNTVTTYQDGSFIDLCRGPHVARTSDIEHFKLLSIAGAYWRGDAEREQLQRIYGTTFFSKKELAEYLVKLEEAKKRDHRKLGQELALFSIHDEVGGGLVHWHPKGATIRNIIETFWKQEHAKCGYQLVYTPHIASEELYRISGHLENYVENMYASMAIENRPYRVKPMNCPNHMMIYKTTLHSYRDLPLRYAELGTVYRFEKSGVLHGLMRVRGFTQDDAHIFCTESQLEDEILGVFNFCVKYLKKFGFTDYDLYIATRPEHYVGSLEMWDKATNVLKNVLGKTGYKFSVDEGGGVFYGPKIDLKIKDALGRPWQCSTIQFDFNLPTRFDIGYRSESGKEERPIMIHRALMGSLERFIGVLIEHYAGKFPLWLAPVQVVVMNISENQADYASEVTRALKEKGLRVELNLDNQKIGYKIRQGTLEKVPYLVIVGDKEKESKNISVRALSGENLGNMDIETFFAKLQPDLQ